MSSRFFIYRFEFPHYPGKTKIGSKNLPCSQYICVYTKLVLDIFYDLSSQFMYFEVNVLLCFYRVFIYLQNMELHLTQYILAVITESLIKD